MYEKLSFSKCDFCGRPRPRGTMLRKKTGERMMNFCSEQCYTIKLNYDDIINFKAGIPL